MPILEENSLFDFNLIIIVVLLSLALLPNTAKGTKLVSSSDLINNSYLYDNEKIYFQAEVIGDIMKRGNDFWINCYDGNEAIGIWGKNNILPEIKFLGDYKHRGDQIKIRGIFHRACPLHNGEMDIHAQSITVISQGYYTPHPVQKNKLYSAIILVLITGLLAWYYRRAE